MMKMLSMVGLLVVATGPAMAHAFLDTADPAVGSTVATSPKAVNLSFTQAVEPSFSTIDVTDAGGTRVDLNDPHVAAGDGSIFSVDLKPLVPGEYHVTWHVTSVDTHKTQGSFSFTVGP